jgi:hypothetical protein
MPLNLPESSGRSLAAAGGVEISGFPQLLLTRECGNPDTLFCPLLGSAREALKTCQATVAKPQDKSQVAQMAAIYLATALLKDVHFTLASKGSQSQNHYVIDFEAETMYLRTWLYATVGTRTSSFLVIIAGNIQTGLFAVRNSSEDGTMVEFDEKRMQQPQFFSSVLSQEYLSAQVSKDHFKRFGNLPMAQAGTGVRMSLALARGTLPILLRKKEASEEWEVIDERTSEHLAVLPRHVSVHLEQLLEALPKVLAK